MARVEIEGGLYHVDNWIASGEPVFSDPEEAIEFVELIRETKARDGWTVLAWCVMSNHYHLVIRTGTVPLWRGIHRIQNLFSRRFNTRLEIDMAVVCSRARDRRSAAARKLIATLGVERWRQSRRGLARVLQKNPDVVSWWAGEGAKSRVSEPGYAAELDRLDRGVAARAAELGAQGRLR